MVFVLDNYDSFTYNLVQYLGELGQKVEVRRNDQVSRTKLRRSAPTISWFLRDHARRRRRGSALS